MEQAKLKPKEERRLLRGHLWAYRNEFDELPALDDGELVEVVSSTGRLVGCGFYQASGGIAVRILTRRREAIDAAFLSRRVQGAKTLREALYPGENVYRWIHGESDGLPGLVADRYGPLIAARTSARFYEEGAADLAQAFLSHEGVEGVRLAVGGRVHCFGRPEWPAACTINGLTLAVDPEGGQKTGLFLDQRENWPVLKPFVRATTVFDGHCYTGVWGLHAALYGAERVLGVDTSAAAVERAREQAQSNGFGAACTFECADVRDALQGQTSYGVVILDPPALAKSRGSARKALGLYQALNRDAMKATEPGGILITSSCSSFVDGAAFIEMLKRAANSAQRRARLLEVRGAARDHPLLLSMPETAYLKCVVLQIM